MAHLHSLSDTTVTIEALAYFVEQLSEEYELSPEIKEMLLLQVERLSLIYGRVIDKREAIQIIAKQIEITRTGFIRDPVGIIEFVESQEYMDQGLYVRPAIMENLIKLFEQPEYYYEVVLGGAIGIGKNYFADMAVAYILYRMSCLYSPQSYYGLAPGSAIVFAFQSKTLTLARKVVFNQFSDRLGVSPYFQRNFTFASSYRSELRFPHSISVVPLSGSSTSALGMNVFLAVLDEMNFMGTVKKSKKTLGTGEDTYDQAEKLYLTVLRRLESRFMKLGRIPGKLFLISSANYKNDFIDRKCEESKENPHIYVMRLAQWEAIPADRFTGKKFFVFLPTETSRGMIFTEKPEAIETVPVPIEYLHDFQRDLPNALRDLAGISVAKRSKFVETGVVHAAMARYKSVFGSRQIFIVPEIMYENLEALKKLIDEDFVARLAIHTVLHGHLDIGISEDSAGLAFGSVMGMKKLEAKTVYDKDAGKMVEVEQGSLPIYGIIGLLRINPPISGRIDINDLRDFILYLGTMIRIRSITLDRFQSVALMQALNRERIKTSILSVDKTPDAYIEFKTALTDERVMVPYSDALLDEFSWLERDAATGKIDHEAGKSKDLSDSVAGVIGRLGNMGRSYFSQESPVFNLVAPIEEVRKEAQVKAVRMIRPSTGRQTMG